MNNVLFFTKAYNAEKTLSRAMDSVLNQTNGNLVYYVLDNGSTDKTSQIICEYMAKDSRVRLLRNEENSLEFFRDLFSMLKSVDVEYDYFAVLDADDEYMPDFLEKSLTFAKENSLDIVCGGNTYVDEVTGKITRYRILPENMILDNGEVIDRNLPDFYKFLRTIWGKIFKLSIMNSLDLEALNVVGMINGVDTLFSLTAFKNAERIGIMHDIVLRYYVSSKSAYTTYYPNRIKSNFILYETACDYLVTKCGSVSAQNENYLIQVYMYGIRDALIVLLDAQVSDDVKIQNIRETFSHEITKDLLKRKLVTDSELDRHLRTRVVKWLFSRKGGRTKDGLKIAKEIILAMYPDLTSHIGKLT